MQIISDYISDTKTEKPNKGSYEWWYFDGLTKNAEYGIVVIFYEGNPFSRRYSEALDSSRKESLKTADNYPALSISVYRQGKPIYYGFREYRQEEALFASDKVFGRVDKSEFIGSESNGGLYYRVLLNQTLPGGDGIEGTLEFTSRTKNLSIVGDKSETSEDNHIWNLVQPCASVKGEISISGYDSHNFLFTGPGYHDHNYGREPMGQDFKHWYWGRFHFTNSLFVYYLMQKKHGTQHEAWLIPHSGTVISVDSEIRLSEKGFNIFGLQSARKIEMAGGGIRCFIQHEKVLDNGPFYQRFHSKALLETETDIEQASGFSEYIYPERIKKKIFWPLVDMRITYPEGDSHWVQRNPRLFRWTW